MKPSLPIPLAVLLLAGAALAAQDTAPDGKAADPTTAADPFVKENSKPSRPGGADPFEQINVGVVVQYLDVKRGRWHEWLAANHASLAAGPLRKEVEGWIAAGDARLTETSLVMGKPGQRAKVESVTNLVYPLEFAEDAAGPPFPKAMESRNAGTTTEVDLVIGEDGSVEANLAPERVAYAGEQPPREDVGVLDGDLRHPVFGVQKATTSCRLDPQSWILIGCERSLESDETHQTLVFVRPLVHRFEEIAAKAEAEAQGMLTWTWLEVTHEFFNASLMEAADAAAWVGGGLHEKARKSGAKVVEERSHQFRSGQRSKNDSVHEISFPTHWDPAGKGVFAKPAAVETWNVGTTVEIDPVISPGGGSLDLNMAPHTLAFVGRKVLHRVFFEGEWKPNATMPAFYTMQPTTQLSLPLDTPVLVAAMSPADGEGWTDSSRKVLLFVKFSR